MKGEKSLRILFAVLLLAIGGTIVGYYWSVNDFRSISRVPVYLMILCLAYVLIQIIKRYVIREQNWWDWLYYIGLASVMLPTFFGNASSVTFYSLLTDIGTLFLIIPVFFDGKKILNKAE